MTSAFGTWDLIEDYIKSTFYFIKSYVFPIKAEFCSHYDFFSIFVSVRPRRGRGHNNNVDIDLDDTAPLPLLIGIGLALFIGEFSASCLLVSQALFKMIKSKCTFFRPWTDHYSLNFFFVWAQYLLFPFKNILLCGFY